MAPKRREVGTGRTTRLAALTLLLPLLAGCLSGAEESLGESSEGWSEEGYLVGDRATPPDVTDDGEPADGTDSPVGSEIDDPEPESNDDPCAGLDDCSPPPADDSPDENAETAPSDDGSQGAAPVEPAPGDEPPTELQIGDRLLTLSYAALRKQPDSQAQTVDVHMNGGAHGGHPPGTVPPGQKVRLLESAPSNGFFRVRYDGREGWIHRNKLVAVDTTVAPVKFARRADVRNAFFMHQLQRGRWNKDGPSSSANCAPTSLAMAAKIFGHATPARTIEQGIHEARRQYDPAPLCESCGTSRSDIRQAALQLGMQVRTLNPGGDVEWRMDRIDAALANKHVVVLEGWAGAKYRQRMTAAYRASSNEWVQGRVYTYGDESEEYHSILVVSRLADGKYLVADPLSEVGMVTMGRATLKSFFDRWGGTGNVVW